MFAPRRSGGEFGLGLGSVVAHRVSAALGGLVALVEWASGELVATRRRVWLSGGRSFTGVYVGLVTIFDTCGSIGHVGRFSEEFWMSGFVLANKLDKFLLVVSSFLFYVYFLFYLMLWFCLFILILARICISSRTDQDKLDF